jgi:hypothetical protein
MVGTCTKVRMRFVVNYRKNMEIAENKFLRKLTVGCIRGRKYYVRQPFENFHDDKLGRDYVLQISFFKFFHQACIVLYCKSTCGKLRPLFPCSKTMSALGLGFI